MLNDVTLTFSCGTCGDDSCPGCAAPSDDTAAASPVVPAGEEEKEAGAEKAAVAPEVGEAASVAEEAGVVGGDQTVAEPTEEKPAA